MRYRRHRRTSGPFLPRAHSGTHKTSKVNLVRTVMQRYRRHPSRTAWVGLGKDAEAKLQKWSKGNKKMNHGDLKRMNWEGEEKKLQDEYNRGVWRAWRKAGPPSWHQPNSKRTPTAPKTDSAFQPEPSPLCFPDMDDCPLPRTSAQSASVWNAFSHHFLNPIYALRWGCPRLTWFLPLPHAALPMPSRGTESCVLPDTVLLPRVCTFTLSNIIKTGKAEKVSTQNNGLQRYQVLTPGIYKYHLI